MDIVAININGGLFKRGVENTREKAFETARNLISNENSERHLELMECQPQRNLKKH